MNRFCQSAAVVALLVIGPVSNGQAQEKSVQTAPELAESITLFNGKDLTGWIGREDLWSVEDGQIVGRTVAEKPLEQNTFLIYTGSEPGNFELTFQFKIENTNSGVQYRSKIIDRDKFVVGGYQADIDFTNRFAGILYEEKGRGILAQRGESVTIDQAGEKTRKKFADGAALGNGIHPGQWNDYRIVANGNHLQHFINEAMTAEVIDNQTDKSASSGVLAFQLHKGEPMVVRFKNIVLHPVK
ncbi:DUF1080 domain-containing protein [Stieleria sp. TO1_6]|uniref:3-keto-disaccharide hydrolase n=1 Tax=Stieleria tagensis TaxID=2956795 RepID=UPI00209B8EC9|nr:DUF1080 domain-containing protein [Stieleria tagensis]MCO8125198.1 DUF1080 domain-containing protein [Stieleria tagensis]